MWGRSWASAALQRFLWLLCGLYRVQGLRASSLCPVARWYFLLSHSFQKVSLFLSFSSTIHSFFSTFGLLAISNLRLACLIRAAILHVSFHPFGTCVHSKLRSGKSRNLAKLLSHDCSNSDDLLSILGAKEDPCVIFQGPLEFPLFSSNYDWHGPTNAVGILLDETKSLHYPFYCHDVT